MLQIIIIIVVVAADLLTKYTLVPMITEAGGAMPIFGNWFYLTFVKNTGASFGIFQNSVPFFIVVTALVLIAALVFMVKTRKGQSLFLKISLSLIVGGAIGNFYDRIVLGYVRDFLDFRLSFWHWVFNVADACLVIGSILLGIYVLFIHKEKDGKPIFAKRDKKISAEEPADNDEAKQDAK